MITPEDEKLYKLSPVPDMPFCGVEESQRLRAAYEESRRRYALLHPVVPREKCE